MDFRVGRWLVQPEMNRVVHGSRSLHVTPKAMDVLVCLAKRDGRVVSRDELFDEVWSGTCVTDDALTKCIGELRRALHTRGREPPTIETIAKRGYRVVAPVSWDGSAAAPSAATGAGILDEEAAAADIARARQVHESESSAAAPTRVRRHHSAAVITLAVTCVAATAAYSWLRRQPDAPTVDLQPAPLLPYSGRAYSPSFSRDGNKLAFTWNSEREDNFDIYVQQIRSGSLPLRLTTDPSRDVSPAWSPDDRYIAFLRFAPEGAGLYVVPPFGGSERRIARLPAGAKEPVTVSWAPDSRWLAVPLRDSPQGPHSIWLIRVDTGERRRLTGPLSTTASGDLFPAISPDGGALAFAREWKSGNHSLYELRLSRDLQPKGQPRELSGEHYAFVRGIAWTGDARSIVYGAGDPTSLSLFRLTTSGRGTPVPLPYSPGKALLPAIALTHPRLAYVRWEVAVGLWRIDPRTRERELLVGSNRGLQGNPQYSPNGRKIVFAATRSGEPALWTCHADGSRCVELASSGGAIVGTPRWSPDGQWIAFDSRADGQSEIYVIRVEGSGLRRMTQDPADDMTPNWSRDGRWIYFGSDRSGSMETWKMPFAGGAPIRVTHGGGGVAFESADGESLYYFKDGAGSPSPLFRMPVRGGAEAQVLPQVWNWMSFWVAARAVYFSPDGRTIQRLDPATGHVSTLLDLREPIPGGFCVSPDDGAVLWTRYDRLTAELMLVDGFR